MIPDTSSPPSLNGLVEYPVKVYLSLLFDSSKCWLSSVLWVLRVNALTFELKKLFLPAETTFIDEFVD